MKNIVYQFYNEGFATLFCQKPINHIRKNISNEKVVKVLSIFIKILYTLGIIALISIMTYVKYS